jgi:hypothetical protein
MEYIEWAKGKRSITLPQEMLDWYTAADGSKDSLAAAQQRIASLEEENASLKAQLAAAHTSGAATRTQPATEARQGRVLESWQAAFRIMVQVILQCYADGAKKRTKTELQSMCSKHGEKLTATQLEFLRGCLPDEHVNREGGPAVQS